MSGHAIMPFLMFSGKAEEAMNLYISVFDRSEIVQIQRYGPNEAGAEGSVFHAVFSLNGQRFACIDSYIQHAFTFTPAISFDVACETAEEVDRVFSKLSEGGQVLMELGTYPFSERFGWVQDRFGISWQIRLGIS
ncbi:MAG: VOC family protein [Bacillota bacterium]